MSRSKSLGRLLAVGLLALAGVVSAGAASAGENTWQCKFMLDGYPIKFYTEASSEQDAENSVRGSFPTAYGISCIHWPGKPEG